MSRAFRRQVLPALVGSAALVLSALVPAASAQAAPPTGKVEYRYDALGRLSSVADPTGAAATYAYDGVGNLTGITRQAAGAAALRGARAAARIAETPDRPVVDGVRQTPGEAGTRLTIGGENFGANALDVQVKVADVHATVLSAKDDEIVAVTAPRANTAGARLTVTTEGGTAGRTLPGTPPAPEPALPTYDPLQAPTGVTALAGVVRTPDGTPLRGVRLSVEEHETRSGRDGRFLLTGLEAGHTELVIDGSRSKAGNHGSYEHGIDLVKGRTTALPWITWLSPIDDEHAVRIPTRVTKKLVVTSPAVPGLEVHVPPGTTLTGEDGERIRSLSITKLDLDRLPFPGAPGMPLAWTIQPGLGEIEGDGLAVVYPNITGQPPGTTIDYVNQDGDRPGIGWAVYGHGQVTEDGTQIVPDEKTRLHELYQLGVSYNPLCPPQDPSCPVAGGGPADGDPVDLRTGLLVDSHTDLTLSDVIPVGLTRTYRQNDSVVRSFGMGQSDDFNVFVAPDGLGRYVVQLPDGTTVPFAPGPGGVYTAVDTPTDFQDAVMTGDFHTQFTVTFTDGRVWKFGSHSAMLISRADRDGNTVTYDRDWSSGRVQRVTSPNGRWIALTWGTCTPWSQCVVRATDNLGRVVRYSYDTSGRLTAVLNPAGKSALYGWNSCDSTLTCTQVASITNANGVVYLRNTFDGSGRVATQRQADDTGYSFDYTLTAGRVSTTTVTDPRGAKHRTEFNADGYAVTDTYAFGTAAEQITTITRAAGTNRVTEVRDPLGRRTTNTYDAAGRLLTSTSAAGTADAQTQTFTYEPRYGRLASVRNALGATSTIEYDDDAGSITATDALGNRTTTEFVAGQPVRETAPLGATSTMSYLDGILVAVGDPLERTTTFYPDAAGRVLRSTDANGRRTSYTYDVMNQVTSSTDPLGQVQRNTYDANGNVLTHTDVLGRVRKSAYDGMNRVTSSTDALNQSTTYAYDATGALASVTDRNGFRTRYGYDLLGRTTFTGFKAVTAGSSTTYESTLTNTYDAGDRLTRIVDTGPGGTLSFTYDQQDRLTGQIDGTGTIGYTYDAADRLTRMTMPGQAATTYTHNALGQVTGITRGTQSVGLAYDAAGRRSSVTLPGNLKQSFVHDAASQVTGINYTSGTTSRGNLTYGYDAAGLPTSVGGTLARVSLPAAWSAATYDANNRLTAQGARTFTYDAEGQLVSDGASTYRWNGRGQLASIAGAVTASFTYDPLGRRGGRRIGTSTTYFLYDGGNAAQERLGSGVSAELLTGPGLDETYARIQGGVTSSFMTDRLGSTVALADSAGAPTTSYTYEPFGKATASGTTSANPFQFTGRENDGTGLQFQRSRYYSPVLQRFISEDPAGAAGSGDNLYAYVGNTPTALTDPTGQFAFLLPILGACALGALESVVIGAALTGEKYSLSDAARDGAMGCGFGLVGAGAVAGGARAVARLRAAQAARTAAPARFITTPAGVTIDRAAVNATVSSQRQGRHVLNAREYGGGSYFTSADDAQRVLNAFHDGSAKVLGVKGRDIVVRVSNVKGYNHNPGAGYPNQATDVFFIKGSSSPSVVPYNPRWTP